MESLVPVVPLGRAMEMSETQPNLASRGVETGEYGMVLRTTYSTMQAISRTGYCAVSVCTDNTLSDGRVNEYTGILGQPTASEQ